MSRNDDYFKGKYFSFFNILSKKPQIIKYKRKEEEFSAANTIWESRIISRLMFDIYYENKKIPQIELEKPVSLPEILFLDQFYFSGQKVDFLVVNR